MVSVSLRRDTGPSERSVPLPRRAATATPPVVDGRLDRSAQRCSDNCSSYQLWSLPQSTSGCLATSTVDAARYRIAVTAKTVAIRRPDERGGVSFTVLARDCPTHRDEAATWVAKAGPTP